MKEQYKVKRFNHSSLAVIDRANEIIIEYQGQGLRLTLRQLYYQFVARGLMENKQRNYKRLGSIISEARLAGLVDWLAIEDRVRNLRGESHWSSPGHIITAAAHSYHRDHWEGQRYKVEVWIEKEALLGVIQTICSDLDVDYFACKGYVSQSEMWAAAKRFKGYMSQGLDPIIIHLGDHDPSGIDMTRDIEDRQELFWAAERVERIALNIDQVRQYDPPPNPAKETDSRHESYIQRFGHSSWELDALEPTVLRDLIREKVLSYRDEDAYQRVLKQEQAEREILEDISKNWDSPKYGGGDNKTTEGQCDMCPLKTDGEEHY